MDKENKCNKYISTYKIGGTIYEVETSFSGTETLNNKIIRLLLTEKIKETSDFDRQQTDFNQFRQIVRK